MTDSPFPVLVERLRDLAADPAAVTDADLLIRFVRDRDPVAFEALVWRHARLVMGVCRRTLRHHQDAEDAFQAVFLLLARKAHRIRRGAALPAWLHTTAVRVSRRARRRRRPVPVAEVPDLPIADPPPEAAETWAVLDAEVRRLPARLRAAFVLCGLEGRSHADAARDLGVPKGTIDSRMAAAKRGLRTALARRGLTLAPAAALTAAVPELAYSDAARRAAAFGLGRSPDVSPAVAGLLAPAGASRWLAGLAAAVTLAAAGTLAVMSGTAGPGDPQKPPDKPADGPKATAERRLPATTPLFKRTTIGFPEDFDKDRNAPAVRWLEKLYASITEDRRKAGKVLIPPSVPSVLGDQMIYMNDLGIGSMALAADKTADPPVRPGELLWTSESGVWHQYRDPYPRRALEIWLEDQADSGLFGGIIHRTVTGLAVQKQAVCWVDDLILLPSTEGLKRGTGRGNAIRTYLSPFNDAIESNAVRVLEPDTGKFQAHLPRYRARPLIGEREKKDEGPFGRNIYLGAPLPLDCQAVIAHEKDKHLRVTCFSWDEIRKAVPDKEGWDGAELAAANSTYLWNTGLVTAPTSVVADPHRRIHAIHLTRAGDLILCPTHLGRVVAVEAKTGKVRWTHEYAPLDAKRFPTFAPEWVVVPPAVVGDRYVYAPADFPELLCLNVADGKKVWSVKKGDGLYPAVVGEQVLAVGEKTIRSLSLKDGSEQWKADLPGLPCGRGVVLGDTYLVPVSEPKTWKGLIAVVDLKAGKVAEVLRPEKDEPIGNLVVHGDFLISQTLTEIAVFPIRKKE